MPKRSLAYKFLTRKRQELEKKSRPKKLKVDTKESRKLQTKVTSDAIKNQQEEEELAQLKDGSILSGEGGVASSLSVNEIKFARKLAAIDKRSRDRTVATLGRFLSKQKHLSNGDMLKIWKGIFYCYWLSDKPFVQHELAESLAKLIHTMPRHGLDYTKAFLQTMEREWHSLDRLRLDKFLALIRKFIEETFRYLQKRSWSAEIINECNTMMSETVLTITAKASGVVFQIISIYLEEISHVGGEELPAKTVNELLAPFFNIMSLSQEIVVVRRVRDDIFLELVENWQRPPPNYPMDEEEQEEYKDKKYLQIDFQYFVSKFQELAQAPETVNANRAHLYKLKEFYADVLKSRKQFE